MSTQHVHDDAPFDPPKLVEVADRVFAYVQPDGSWFINNTGFITAPDGVIAIDTCSTEKRTRAFLDSVRSVTPAPLRAVVNTHHHGDHTHGNYLTHPAAIIAHDSCRDLVIASGISHYEGVWEGADWGHLELSAPMITFAERSTVWAGDRKIELHYIGTPAHTTNDIVAWLPEEKVLYAGDLVFNGGTPFVLMGSVSGSLEALERVRSFGAETIVPGHGGVCDVSALDKIIRYYRMLQSVAAEAVRSDTSALDAARATDLGEFADLTDRERIVGNLHRAMLEERGGAPGAPMNLVAAIGDMIAYNGGKPLRCFA